MLKETLITHYVLSDDPRPSIRIEPRGTYIDLKLVFPKSINIVLPNGNVVDIEQIVDFYMEKCSLDAARVNYENG